MGGHIAGRGLVFVSIVWMVVVSVVMGCMKSRWTCLPGIIVTTMVVIVIVMRVMVSTMTIAIRCCDVRHDSCELDLEVGVC